MSTKISEDEFLQLQTKILELRASNYTLEERHSRQISRCTQLQEQVEALEKECVKARNALSLAQKLKSSDLMSQNEALLRRLQSQENDFQLQHQTLLQELSSLSQENQRLSGVVQQMSSEAEINEKVTRLQSETSALQRGLMEEKENSAQEISKLKGVLHMFTNYMDNSLRIEVFGKDAAQLTPKSRESGDVSESQERGNQRQNINQEECQQGENEIKHRNMQLTVVSTSRLAQLELAEAMQDIEKVEMEERENSLLKTQQELNIFKAQSQKKIEDLEVSFQRIVNEREKLLGVIAELGSDNDKLRDHVEQLKYRIKELEIDVNGRHAKSIEAMKVIGGLNQQLCGLTSTVKQKDITLAQMEKAMGDLSKEVQQQTLTKDMHTAALEQQLADKEAELSLRERKGAVVCRDLRRQLAAERRRVERLQERMREVLEGRIGNGGAESCKVADVDVTSISSWSLMSGNLEQPESCTGDNSLLAGSPTNVNGNMFQQPDDFNLEQESRNLLERVASLQEEKWALEEKVNQLELANATMSQDLMKKSEIIEFYCMEGGRQEPQPSSSGKIKAVKKLSDFLKASEAEHLQESNARMQRMLEELLTKNMFLQRDLENISKDFKNIQELNEITAD